MRVLLSNDYSLAVRFTTLTSIVPMTNKYWLVSVMGTKWVGDSDENEVCRIQTVSPVFLVDHLQFNIYILL